MAHSLRSQTGCYRCRRRRVKCDERKPTCRACAKHNFDCVWPSTASRLQIWRSQTAVRQVYARMLLHERYGKMKLDLAPETRANCPVYSISSGYAPLQDNQEHSLLSYLAAFMRLQAAFTSHHVHLPTNGFEYTVALEEPWVRSSLLSLAALIAAARGLSSVAKSFEYYDAAILSASPRLLSKRGHRENEALLVATLFLGLMDTNIVSNQVHPSCYYMTVGRILTDLGMMDTDLMSRNLGNLSPSLWFRRIAYESYLHQMAGGAFRHPQSYKSVRLIHPSVYDVGSLPSSVDTNSLAPLDLNCFYILYEISRLYHSPKCADNKRDLEALQQVLQDLQARYERGPAPQTNFLGFQFKTLTCTAIGVLQIFCAKAIDDSLTPMSPEIQKAREYSLRHLRRWFVKSLWPGYLSWILVVLLCAAETRGDVQSVCDKIDEFLANTFSANLDHLKGVVKKLTGMQGPHYQRQQQQDQTSITVGTPDDPLALMFSQL